MALASFSRRTMMTLIETVMPQGGIFTLDLREEMLHYVEDMLRYVPPVLRTLFPLGLLRLEYGPPIFIFRFSTFSGLSPDDRVLYIENWTNSRLDLRRTLIKGVKGLAVMAYFEHPHIKAQIGFMSDEWVKQTAEQRWETYADEIQRIEDSIA